MKSKKQWQNTIWCNIEYCCIEGGYAGLANKTYGPVVPLQKLTQAGKATNSLVQLPVTMTLYDSQSLTGHTSSISTQMTNSSLKIQLTKCKRHLLNQKERRCAAFAVEKDDIIDLVLKAWDEYFTHIATKQKAVAKQGWVPLNYNLLLHLEIQLTITSNLQTEANNNQPVSSIPPYGLNLSQCISHWNPC